MRFSLLVKTAPEADQSKHALRFAQALSESGHSLYRIFFLSAGVMHSQTAEAEQWAAVQNATKCDLCLCPASVEKHLPQQKHHEQFSIGGLVQLVDASTQSDRLVTL